MVICFLTEYYVRFPQIIWFIFFLIICFCIVPALIYLKYDLFFAGIDALCGRWICLGIVLRYKWIVFIKLFSFLVVVHISIFRERERCSMLLVLVCINCAMISIPFLGHFAILFYRDKDILPYARYYLDMVHDWNARSEANESVGEQLRMDLKL